MIVWIVFRLDLSCEGVDDWDGNGGATGLGDRGICLVLEDFSESAWVAVPSMRVSKQHVEIRVKSVDRK